MKIFFHSPVNAEEYEISKLFWHYLKELGHTHLIDFSVVHTPEQIANPQIRKQAKLTLDKHELAIRKADVVILGANTQSIGVGVFLHIATHLSKPIIALCKKRATIPFFYEASDYNKLLIYECDENNYKKVLPRALSKAEKLIDKRFTLLLPPDVVEMLDNHYNRTGETRSEYIRNLIKEDQAKRALQPPTRYLARSE